MRSCQVVLKSLAYQPFDPGAIEEGRLRHMLVRLGSIDYGVTSRSKKASIQSIKARILEEFMRDIMFGS